MILYYMASIKDINFIKFCLQNKTKALREIARLWTQQTWEKCNHLQVRTVILWWSEQYIEEDSNLFQKETKWDTATIISPNTERVMSIEDLMKKCDVDESTRDIERSVVNKRDNVMKDAEWKAIITELYQVKARLKKKNGISKEEMQQIIAESIKWYSIQIPLEKREYNKWVLAEVNISDPHFWKLARKDETWHSYDLKIAERMYLDRIDEIISDISLYNPERIVYIIGNDYFHIDNKHNTTTQWTPQDVDSRHQKWFQVWLKVARESIEKLWRIAPVDVIVVYGNHDKVASYHLWVVLETLYEWNEHITIDNTPKEFKVYEYGKCMLCFDHGEWPKENQMAQIAARDYPEIRWRTRFREWHRWHFHKEMTNDYNWFRVRTQPSISAPDAWHASKWYGSLRWAKWYIRLKDKWLKAELHSNI